MKRKPLIALGMVLLFAVAAVWHHGVSSPHFVGGFSVRDFREIERLIRDSMWGRAFPNFSLQTIAGSPQSLWSLATARIEQMDVFAGGTSCRVRVRTPQGLYLVLMERSAREAGGTDWRIRSQRLAGDALIKRLEGLRGFNRLPVKGGLGLFGGKPPAVFYTLAVLPEDLPNPTTPVFLTAPQSASGPNPFSLSLEPHLLLPNDGWRAPAPTQDVILSGSQFSNWLSNHSKLELRP